MYLCTTVQFPNRDSSMSPHLSFCLLHVCGLGIGTGGPVPSPKSSSCCRRLDSKQSGARACPSINLVSRHSAPAHSRSTRQESEEASLTKSPLPPRSSDRGPSRVGHLQGLRSPGPKYQLANLNAALCFRNSANQQMERQQTTTLCWLGVSHTPLGAAAFDRRYVRGPVCARKIGAR